MNGDLQRLGVLKFTLSTAQEEEPDQDEDGNRHPDQPQQTTRQHRVLLVRLRSNPAPGGLFRGVGVANHPEGAAARSECGDQRHAGDHQEPAEDPPEAGGMPIEADPAEMVEHDRGDHARGD